MGRRLLPIAALLLAAAFLAGSRPARAEAVLDLDPVAARLGEGAAGGSGPALVRTYERLLATLARPSRGLHDDLRGLRAVAKACASRLSADLPLRDSVADSLDDGAAAVRAKDAAVLAQAGLLLLPRNRDRVLAAASRARTRARAGELELSLGNHARAATLLRRAALAFDSAARRAARLLVKETPKSASWEVPLHGRPAALLGVWGEPGPSPRLYAVGAGDASGPQFLVLHPGAEGWIRVPVAASGDLWWVTGVPGDGVWACGSGGRVVRYDPATGDLEDRGTGLDVILYGIWGSGPDDVWAVGGDPDGVGPRPALLHWDGVSWSEVEAPAAAADRMLYKVHGSAADDVWAVGQGGTLLHFDGTAWASVDAGTLSTLLTVHGTSPPIAVGGGASAVVVERGEGGAWAQVPVTGVASGSGSQFPGPVSVLNGVHVPPSGEALAVGLGRSVVRRGTSGWTGVAGVPTAIRDLHAVWIDDAGNAVMVGGRLSNLTEGLLATYGKLRLPSVVVPRARFRDGLADVLFSSCAHSACHLPPFTNASFAVDTPEVTRANLVSVPSVQSPLLRVSPGRPSQSYLWHKLAGTHASVGGTGLRMPPPHDVASAYFTDEEMELVRAWILDGARDD